MVVALVRGMKKNPIRVRTTHTLCESSLLAVRGGAENTPRPENGLPTPKVRAGGQQQDFLIYRFTDVFVAS